ncbi:xylulokinase [Microbacterium aquimaris]|uniref:Xylulose kinase n=1 Tax=Microbacterium aquimaris TaxID=459816 RepID=A0ABU5N5C2_9MICO|nr:xylulokinase [Microbacterium aquimaris]MDZ8161287.1 xylulokinase [Microbacterium aquimaris]
MSIVAGVDSSTQSCTVELRDADTGRLRGTGRAAHPPTTPPRSEQDPERWWSALREALLAAVTDAGIDATEIAAISIAAQCHGLVLLDEHGRVLRAAKLWNDTESAPQAQRAVAARGERAWVDAIGSVPTAAFTISKLMWVAEHEPDVLDRARHVLLPHDFLTFRLADRAVTDRSEASGTGYYSAREGRWRTDLLDEFVRADLEWESMLPTVLGPDEVAGTISTGAAEQLGLGHDVVIAAGAGDQHAGALGVGLKEGDVLYSLGTSGVVITTSRNPVFDPSGAVNGVADAAGGYLPLICTLNSTKVTDATARWLNVTLSELSELALAAPPREDRPVLVAYLDGERTPNRPDATGTLGGLTTDTTREDIARAAFEGVLFGLAAGHEAIRAAGAAADGEVSVVGGGAKSPAYRQMLADILQKPVLTKDVVEATARGACVQAAAVLRGAAVATVRDAWTPAVSTTTEPAAPSPRAAFDRYIQLARTPGLTR